MNLLLDKIKNLSHTRQAEKLNSPRYHLIMLSHNCINAYMMKGKIFLLIDLYSTEFKQHNINLRRWTDSDIRMHGLLSE